MDIKPIQTETDYEIALNEVERLWGSEPGTPEGARFEVLFTLVEIYEDHQYPILPPEPETIPHPGHDSVAQSRVGYSGRGIDPAIHAHN